MNAAHGELFNHLSAEKSASYRVVLDCFAADKRRFGLTLRPDDVLSRADWSSVERPTLDQIQHWLAQLTGWGNLARQPDTARVTSIEDFNRARFLYRLSEGGEAVEAAMLAFTQAMQQRGELQSVALADILTVLTGLQQLAAEPEADSAKIHAALRDLTGRFKSLADNAQAFMSGLMRAIDLQRVEAAAVMVYKQKLLGYLDRFVADLVSRSARIAETLLELDTAAPRLLKLVAEREAQDAAPDDSSQQTALEQRLAEWQARWQGLHGWFIGDGREPSHSSLLRQRAVTAIPQLLLAIAALNERRTGRSDRNADYRQLARWFMQCSSDADAHRLYRAAFALAPARHLALRTPDAPAATAWARAAPALVPLRLRERGSLTPRGAPSKVQDRGVERALIQQKVAAQQAQLAAARARLADGVPRRLSELGPLNRDEFELLLAVLGEALGAQGGAAQPVSRSSGDGQMHIELMALDEDSHAEIATPDGIFSGRDHLLTLTVLA